MRVIPLLSLNLDSVTAGIRSFHLEIYVTNIVICVSLQYGDLLS
jgi:hypothetical protein